MKSCRFSELVDELVVVLATVPRASIATVGSSSVVVCCCAIGGRVFARRGFGAARARLGAFPPGLSVDAQGHDGLSLRSGGNIGLEEQAFEIRSVQLPAGVAYPDVQTIIGLRDLDVGERGGGTGLRALDLGLRRARRDVGRRRAAAVSMLALAAPVRGAA